jgi:tRNA(Ile)-lysidine synthase
VFSKLALQVLETIQKHQMFTHKERLLAGVSGGADSVCLVLVLRELGFDVAIAHLNHGLRGADSDEDERFTASFAARSGLRFFSKRAELASGNVEAAGREARHRFFKELIAQEGFGRIVLAHTRDDRVETFFLHLLRGSGTEGLASIAPASGNTVRPLIETQRVDIEKYLKEHDQPWRTDASNLDLAFKRNRLRHVVLPNLASEFNPNLQEAITRTIRILQDEDEFMRTHTQGWLAANGTNQGDAFVVSIGSMDNVPMALIRRILRGALRMAGSELQEVSFDHIEAVRALLEPGKSGKLVEVPGMLVLREFDKLVFRRTPLAATEYDYELKIPGHVHIREVRKVFRAEVLEGNRVEEVSPGVGERVFVDAESIGPYVRIRNWKPGDYYRPVGLPAGKLKKLFQRARIPRSHRTSWPVVVAESTIIWVASFPVSREFAPRGRSQKIVALEAQQI